MSSLTHARPTSTQREGERHARTLHTHTRTHCKPRPLNSFSILSIGLPFEVLGNYSQGMEWPDIRDGVTALVGGSQGGVSWAGLPLFVWDCSVWFESMAGECWENVCTRGVTHWIVPFKDATWSIHLLCKNSRWHHKWGDLKRHYITYNHGNRCLFTWCTDEAMTRVVKVKSAVQSNNVQPLHNLMAWSYRYIFQCTACDSPRNS